MFKMIINIIRLALIVFVIGAGALVWRGIHTIYRESIHYEVLTVYDAGKETQYGFSGQELVDGLAKIIVKTPDAMVVRERRLYENGDILEWCVEDGDHTRFRYGLTVPIAGRIHIEWTVGNMSGTTLESL